MTADSEGPMKKTLASFLVLDPGYYDYEQPLAVVIHDIDTFQGKLVHTQCWPENLDLTDKNVVITGNGAISKALSRALAEKAFEVTML